MKVVQSCPTLCNSMDCIVHGILQARILEWVAFPFSRGSSQLRDRTQVSRIAGRFFTSWVTREAFRCLCITESRPHTFQQNSLTIKSTCQSAPSPCPWVVWLYPVFPINPVCSIHVHTHSPLPLPLPLNHSTLHGEWDPYCCIKVQCFLLCFFCVYMLFSLIGVLRGNVFQCTRC